MSKMEAKNGFYGHSGNKAYSNSGANHLYVGKNSGTSNYRSRMTFPPLSSIPEIGDNRINIKKMTLYLRRNDGGPTKIYAACSSSSGWGANTDAYKSAEIEAKTDWHSVDVTPCAEAVMRYTGNWYMHITSDSGSRIRFDGTSAKYRPYLDIEWEYVHSTITSDKEKVTLGEGLTLMITPEVAGETRTLEYSIGNARGVILENKSSTTIGFAPQESLATEIVDDYQGTLEIKMTAFNPDGTVQRIEKFYQTVVVPPSMAVSFATLGTELLNGLGGFALAGRSSVSIRPKLNTNASYGASVFSVVARVVNGDKEQTITWNEFVESTPGIYTCAQAQSFVFDTVGDAVIYFTVEDSRGYAMAGRAKWTVCEYAPPEIMLFSMERYSPLYNEDEEIDGYVVDDLGGYMWCNFEIQVSSVAPAETELNSLHWSIVATNTSTGEELRTSGDADQYLLVTQDMNLFPSPVSEGDTWNCVLTVTDTAGNSVSDSSLVRPGRVNFALAASKYGAAFGGLPKGTMGNPMLESYYPAFFYSNIYGSFPGVNTYSEEEVATGGTWIDGKKIYRKVLTGDVTASTSSNTSLGIISGIKDIIRMDAMFARSSDGNNFVHPMPYYNSATRYFVPFYNPATGDFLVQATHTGTAILIVDYTRLVDDIFSIVIQPQNIVSNTVEGVQFSVNAVGVTSYEWQYGSDGVKFYSLTGFDGWTGTNRSTLTLASNANLNWFYRCRITGIDGTEMYTNVVRIIPSNAGIVITTQPADINANAGDTVTFSVVATGVASYQWQVGGTNGANWTDLTWTGSNASSMSHTMNETNIKYVYRCRLTGSDGTVLYTNTIKFI